MSKIPKREDAKIKMFKAIALLYLTYKARFDVIAAFEGIMGIFNNRQKDIDRLVPLSTQDTKDMTKQRDALRLPLYTSAMVVAKAVKSYASSIGNLVLKGEMNWTEAKLEAIPLDQLGPICSAIHNKATEFLKEAGPFGLDQAKLDALDADNKAWTAKEAGTRNMQVEISGHKRELSGLIAENMALLTDQLDEMVFTLSASDPALVALWEQARIMVQFPTTVTQVKYVVMDKLTGDFIFKAAIQLENGVTHKAITNVDGEAEIKGIKQGLYLSEVIAVGYKPYKVYQQRLLKGKITRLLVELEPEE